MSTKNLARTVIEGGRDGSSKWDRRFGLQMLRARNHTFCRRAIRDTDFADDNVYPVRHITWGGVSHKDKTNPCDRFLISRAGRPWNKVHSEICKKFDRRKLAGRHVTEDHLIARVRLPDSSYWFWTYTFAPKFWVDGHGILRHNEKARY
jgi:hypothetical protein